jgi:hypothetical protein
MKVLAEIKRELKDPWYWYTVLCIAIGFVVGKVL